MCDVPDCTKPRKGLGLCAMHYTRHRRGSPLGGAAPRKRPAGATCLVDGCERPDTGPAGLCAMHKTRLRRDGDVGTAAPRIASRTPGRPTYTGAHRILRRVLGAATERLCTDCGGQAAEWSYLGGGVPDLMDHQGRRYSTDSTSYAPRCRSCHRIFDHSVLNLEPHS